MGKPQQRNRQEEKGKLRCPGAVCCLPAAQVFASDLSRSIHGPGWWIYPRWQVNDADVGMTNQAGGFIESGKLTRALRRKADKSDCDLKHSVGTSLDMRLCLCGCASSRSRYTEQCSAWPSKPPTNTPYPCNCPTSKLQLRWLVPLVPCRANDIYVLSLWKGYCTS